MQRKHVSTKGGLPPGFVLPEHVSTKGRGRAGSAPQQMGTKGGKGGGQVPQFRSQYGYLLPQSMAGVCPPNLSDGRDDAH